MKIGSKCDCNENVRFDKNYVKRRLTTNGIKKKKRRN